MTVLVWCLVVVWLGLALCGFWKGAVRLVFGIGGAVVGAWLALVAGPDLILLLEQYMGPLWLAAVLGYLLPFVLCLALCLAAGWDLERTITTLKMGWLNRLLGAVLAGGAAAVLLTLLLVTASSFSPTWANLCDRSLLAPYLLSLLDLVSDPEGSTPPAAEELIEP
jgi:uncharacterized membrane protein required for colicin V production